MRITLRSLFMLAIFGLSSLQALAENFPVISSNAATESVAPGSAVTLTATTAYVPTQYRWRHNQMQIEGATGATLTFNAVSLADAGVYTVETRLENSGTYVSFPFYLSVIGTTPVAGDRCWIVPSELVFEPGMNSLLTVRAKELSSADSIQWFKDGAPIPGATKTSYPLDAMTAANAGSYSAIVNGSTSSAGLVILNQTPPLLDLQPISTYSPPGGSANFRISFASRANNFVDSMQWYKDGVPIPGATFSSYNIIPVTAADYGDYIVKVTNAAGTTSSQVASLWPYTPPTITRQPAQQVVALDGTIELSVGATGPSTILPLSYEWSKDSIRIAGATGATLTIPHATEADAGFYRVMVFGKMGPATSIDVSVSVGFKSPVQGALSIISQPQGVNAIAGTDVVLNIGVSGFAPISYQWSKDGNAIPGATNDSLMLPAVTMANAGAYKVVVTNNQSSVTSQTAQVTVNDSNGTPTPSYSRPIITVQPTSKVAALGTDVTFAFDFTSETFALIRWYKNGFPLASAAAKTLTLHGIQASDAGSYSAEVSNVNGSTLTTHAVLSVQAAPFIRTQPSDTAVTAGDNLILAVLGFGTPDPTYQWYKADVAIPGATGASLLISGVTAEAAGTYRVVLSNSGGTVSSNSAQVTVLNRSALTGTYFGKFGNDGQGGEFALVVRSNGSCLLIGYLTGQKTGIVAEFPLSPDGNFTAFAASYLLQQLGSASATVARDVINSGGAVTSASSAGYVIKGQIQPSAVTGQIPDLSLSLSGNAAPSSGPATSYAGAYSASGADASNHTLYSVVGADGRIMVLDTSSTGANSGVGTISSSGGFSVSTGGGRTVNGDIGNNGLTGKLSDSGGNTTTFQGGSDAAMKAVRLTNISTRAYTGAGSDVIIAGFIVQGVATHRVLIRAVGPGLATFHVSGILSSPVIQLFHDNTKILEATLGADAPDVITTAQQVGAFPLAQGAKDVALVQDLPPGAYTVQVRNTNGANGIVLVEVYDASGAVTADTKLFNVSTRGHVGAGDQQMIAGFIVAGSAPKKVLVRAIGPTLAQFNVDGLLANPRLEVHDTRGVVAANDDWNNSAEVAAATAQINIFPLAANSKDAALVLTLAPGPYTVIVSGADGGVGNALVEVYEYSEL